jgi:TolA-binding protein
MLTEFFELILPKLDEKSAMNFPKMTRNQVLGVMVDGTDLKIAHLGLEKKEIVVYSLESISLPIRLGRYRSQAAPQNATALDLVQGDVFGIEPTEDDDSTPPIRIEEGIEATIGDASGALVNVFSRYPLDKGTLALNIPEGQATFYNFESNFGLKGKKLDKRLREEISAISGGMPESARLDYFKTENDGLMVALAEGNIPLIDELIEIKSFLPGGVPHFSQVTSNELALVNMVRLTLDPPSNQITAVVYIGCDFSRVIIMRGGEPISFVQSIREGYFSPQVCHTIFSKILLEQEEAGIPDINKIVLSGEIGMTRAYEFFSRQFPEAEVGPLTSGPLNTNFLKSEEIAIFANYAVPVSIAWEVLDQKNSSFIRTNLIPRSVRESQKAFKIAWHGFALLGIVFCGMVIISYQGLSQYSAIKSLKHSIATKQATVETLQPDLSLINQLQSQIATAKANLEFMDTLILDPDKWSRLFSNLTLNFKNVRNIWIDNVQSTPDGFNMIGRALARDRIPRLAENLPGVNLKRVTRVVSEDGEVIYEFELTAKIPDPVIGNEPAQADQVLQEQTQITPSEQVNSAPVTLKQAEPLKEEMASVAATPTPEPLVQNTKLQPSKEQTPSVIVPAPPPDTTPLGPEKPKTVASEQKPQTLKSNIPSPTPVKSTVKPKPTELNSSQPAPDENPPPIGSTSATADLYQNGMRLVKSGNPQSALPEFGLITDKFPDSKEAAPAFYWSGECYYAMSNFSEAIIAFEKSLQYKANSKTEAALLMLGNSYLKLGDQQKAKEQYDTLLERFPDGQFTGSAKLKLSLLAR